MEIVNLAICLFKFCSCYWWRFWRCFLRCVPLLKFWKNQDFGKIKFNDGIIDFSFSIEKVLKRKWLRNHPRIFLFQNLF